MAKPKSIERRAKSALEFAKKRSKSAANWHELHQALYGVQGKCTQLFPTRSDRAAFAGTEEYRKIAALVDKLPEPKEPPPAATSVRPLQSANGKILVRVPRSVHSALLMEAEVEGVSLNQLILAKLTMQLRAAV